MANARKVIMRTKVSLLDAVGTLEEETHDDYIASSSIGSVSTNGRWGGNSVNTDISSSQTGNWSSFVESENIDWNLNAQNWEEAGAWTGDFGLTTTGVPLSTDTSDLKFLYIKNTGSDTVEISLDEGSSYLIKLSANASTMLRGTSDLDRDEVYVKASDSTSTVDYILAG
jgi:hypothetical protein